MLCILVLVAICFYYQVIFSFKTRHHVSHQQYASLSLPFFLYLIV